MKDTNLILALGSLLGSSPFFWQILATPLSSTQLQRSPVEWKQHNTIEEQRSTIIKNIGLDIYWPHKSIYHQTYKNVEENLNSFINIKNSKEDYNQLFWPSVILSSRSSYSPHEKLRSPNTMMLQQETNNTSLQDTKFQPLDLWDEGSI